MKLVFVIGTALALTVSVPAYAACVESTDPWAIVHAQDVAYNAHDVDAFADCYADDAVIEGLSEGLSRTHPPIVGIAAIKEKYQFLKTAPKSFHTKFINKIIVGPIVIVHEVAVGGPADWPRPDWHKESIAIFEVRNSKVVHVWFAPRK